MLLKSLAKQIFHFGGNPESIPEKIVTQKGMPLRRVLNVGGANKQIPIPAHYDGWNHALLDIQDGPEVDLVMDSRNLRAAVDIHFDAIYCSHNLEHYFAHDVNIVLEGFLNVLKDDGFAEIIVPDIRAVLKRMFENNMDVDDVLYHCPSGPITIQDVVWGWGKQIEESGVDFYAHKIGFTDTYLTKKLVDAGFGNVWTMISPDAMELKAFAFKTKPTEQQNKMLGLPASD